ncbi:Uncharacterized protein OBRU01_14480 [Operophtera brumata]|uniref:Cytochrome P450 n=1 Tax=Operophtera brumata TaxID=104452 RepID=A0A0L7L6P3_OPEBR|nr:Uncharacterized protein OBRU01_14480 [Operophtera brumata]
MFKHISVKRNALTVGKYVHSANSIINSVRAIGKNAEFYKTLKFEDIPGPRSYPVIGTLYNYLPMIGDYKAESLDKNAWLNWRRYGSLVREVPLVKLLHVFDPEDIEAVFRQDDRYPARRSHVAINGPDWWRLRSAFQKNFTSPQSVRGHIQNIDSVTREFIQWIKQKKVSENEDFLYHLNRLNLEGKLASFNMIHGCFVIGKVAFNESFNSFSENEQDVESRSSKVIAAAFGSNSGIMKLDKGFLWKMFQTPLYKKLAKSQEYLEKVSTKILIERIHFFDNENIVSDHSLLGSFLQQDNVDFKDIVGMMVDILMAAIDTTAFSTSFALYHLARNPKAQEKVYSEVKTLLPNEDSKITAETLSNAEYTRSCIKESLRLNPVSIGTVIVTQNMIASRLPQFVQDPLAFKPERWQRSSCHHESIHPFTSLPFGFGPRSYNLDY